MASTLRSSYRSTRRYLSPPPEIAVDGHHSLLHLVQKLIISFLHASRFLYCDMSPLHCILTAQLLVLVAIIEFVRPVQTETSLATALRLIKLGLVADRISAVAVQLRKSSSLRDPLNSLRTKVPYVTGLSTELAIAVLALRSGSARVVHRFLIGSVYVKILAVGGLCLILNTSILRLRCVSQRHARQTTSAWLLVAAGALALASPPRIDSGSIWYFHGAPLFLAIYLGFVYHYGDWDEQAVEEKEQHALEVENRYIIASGDSRLYLAIFLLILKALGTWIVYALLASFAAVNDTRLEFVVLPLASAAIDHAVDIRLALGGDIGNAWMSISQSIFRTYFFIRPLAAFMDRTVDLSAGRIGFSVWTAATAIWLSIPGVPHCLKGAMLIFAYGYLSYTCFSQPDSVFCHIM